MREDLVHSQRPRLNIEQDERINYKMNSKKVDQMRRQGCEREIPYSHKILGSIGRRR